MRRKVVNRVKFKSTQIHLAFKALFSVSASPLEPSRSRPPSRKLRINWNREKEPPRRAIKSLRDKIPFVNWRKTAEESGRYTSKLGPCQIDKPQIVEEQLSMVMRAIHVQYALALLLSLKAKSHENDSHFACNLRASISKPIKKIISLFFILSFHLKITVTKNRVKGV